MENIGKVTDNKEFPAKKLSILFLLTQDLESPSGIGRYYPLSKNLVKLGFCVSIAAPHSNFSECKEKSLNQEGVQISYVSQMHVAKRNNQTDYYGPVHLLWITLVTTLKLFLFVVRNPADIIVIAKPHPMNSIAGLMGGKLIRAKIILDCDDYEAVSNYFRSPWQQWVVKGFENVMPKLVHHVTTNTHFNKDRMINSGVPPEKIDYLPNGIDHERFQNIDKNIVTKMVQDLNLQGKKVIGYIGSISLANHPVDLLINAFKLVIQQEKDTRLLVVGGGKDLEKLKQLTKDLKIEDYVRFVGRVPPHQVPYYYKIAHVTVDPVNDDDAARGRCPLKMFESWAMGIPFITADVGDRANLFSELGDYSLAIPGNTFDMAEKILIILKDERLASQISDLCKDWVKKYYWDNIVTNNLHIFMS